MFGAVMISLGPALIMRIAERSGDRDHSPSRPGDVPSN
jgi:hypothetical protein